MVKLEMQAGFCLSAVSDFSDTSLLFYDLNAAQHTPRSMEKKHAAWDRCCRDAILYTVVRTWNIVSVPTEPNILSVTMII